MRFLRAMSTTGFAAAILALGAAPSEGQAAGWPRVKEHDGVQVVLHQPQIDSWVFYTQLEARFAVEVTPEGSSEAFVGALRIRGATRTDLESRRVLITDIEVVETSFPTLDAEQKQKWDRWLAGNLRRSPQDISLDEILAYFEHTEATAVAAQPPIVASSRNGARGRASRGGAPAATGLSMEPPAIHFSQKPAILVIVDGKPARFPVDGTDLAFVVNTNWPLFFERSTERYFLLDGDSWLTAATLEGPWSSASRLPADLSRLPAGEQWAEIRENVPGRRLAAAEVPVVLTSTEPAELILVDGPPDLDNIPGTDLSYVVNTESDLFFARSDGRFYYLVSGRWFAAEDLRGPWTFATPKLPADFQRIPADHPRGRVSASVPGTPQAKEAALLAQVPTKATVKRSAATAEVVYQGPPEFSSIEGTTMAYAVNTSSDVLKIGGRFYLCFQGVWFVSSSAHGPWVVVDKVPDSVYTIPASSPVHHLSYVYVYDSSPDVVVVGYTPGYSGLYVSWGCVVYGTGYYYPPYVYWGAYPVYYPYPYSYGAAAYYNPVTRAYGRGAVAYGPYGGVGGAAVYNPVTGTYARGVSAWGPGGGTVAHRAYNPRTQTSRAGYQSANAYSQWGEGVVRRGDDWVHTGHYSDSRGTVAGYETSRGGKGAGVRTDEGGAGVGKGADGSLYAGKDGNVYKRSDGGWSRYEDGGWNQVERSRTRQLDGEARARAQGAGRGQRSNAHRSRGGRRGRG